MSAPLKPLASKKSRKVNDEVLLSEATASGNKAASISSIWLQKFEMGAVSSSLRDTCMFREYWKVAVPKIYAPRQNCTSLQLHFDENLAQKMLFEPLERFICKSEPEKVFKNLTEKDDPPVLCGKVFKTREPCYNCRDCGLDPTCVLCVDCFSNSVHQKHRYRMVTSEGGGYCDCGDKEAWKTSPHCEIHSADSSLQNSASNPLEKLSKDLVNRARFTFDAVIWYCIEMLTGHESRKSLPQNLLLKHHEINLHEELKATNKLFCTLLYNNETRTFEDVVMMLTPGQKFTHKQAVEFANLTDREGRCMLYCGTFTSCDELLKLLNQQSSQSLHASLKVMNVSSHHIAHQIFAMRLLRWLQRILSYAEGFRTIFSEIILKNDLQSRKPKYLNKVYGKSMLEAIFCNDALFLKSVRKQWHNLFVSGLLMESESKKAFAEVFTRNYFILMKKFIDDEYEHTLSVTSLSVQLFTVTSLAHHLIAEEGAFAIVLQSFINECQARRNEVGKWDTMMLVETDRLFRAKNTLYDLLYLLSVIPDTWTEKLKACFLHGVRLLLEFLSWIQGMDPHIRHVDEHILFEDSDWEFLFELCYLLFSILSLIQAWCGSDKVTLIWTYRATLEQLSRTFLSVDKEEIHCELIGYTVQCVKYDVRSQPVSIHLPLCRLLAGLHLHLLKFGVSFETVKFFVKDELCPTIEQVIEPVLRTQVMIAQVYAGMWRRNGHSLLNQVYLYHSVKYRSEMLDQDIVLLQIGCTLIDCNKYLIHLLNKFNLLKWAQNEYNGVSEEKQNQNTDEQQQTETLVEEFFSLLITVIGERYVPGVGEVTTEECLKKEIIQKLCVKPMTHSELDDSLPSDISEETGLEKVIDEVAVMKNASQGSGKKTYELKPEFYKEYNIFYYHYTHEEQSQSEEVQRKRRRLAEEEECCPPPPLPSLTPAFKNLSFLIQCDVMQHIMKIVLQRAADMKPCSEGQLHKILHLIGYALHDEERYQKEGIYFGFTEFATKCNILSLLEKINGNPWIETQKDLLNWILHKFHQVVAMHRKEEVYFNIKETEESKEVSQAQKKRRAEMAAECRAKVMAQMTALQKNFMKVNAKMFEEKDDNPGDISCSNQMDADTLESVVEFPVAVGPMQTRSDASKHCYTCILCQEDQVVSLESPSLVLAAFVQKSTVLSQLGYSQKQLLRKNPGRDPRVLPADLNSGPYTSTCGHVMHSDCWKKFFESVKAKEKERGSRYQNYASFNVNKLEYLCPLCDCLSNTVLPVFPLLGKSSPLHPPVLASCGNITFEEFIQGLKIVVKHMECTEHLLVEGYDLEIYKPCRLSQVVSELGSSTGEKFATLFTGGQTVSKPLISKSLCRMVDIYSRTAYVSGLKEDLVPIFAWQSCAYTIHTIECLLRDQQKPVFGSLSLRQKDCLSNLVRLAGSGCNHPQRDMASHCLYVLSGLLKGDNLYTCILDWDAFSALVTLSFSLPNLFNCTWPPNFPAGNIQELFLLKLIFLVHIIQILLTTDFNTYIPMDIEENNAQELHKLCEETSDTSAVLSLLQSISLTVNGKGYNSYGSSDLIWHKVCEACIPFLRCCALFYHHLTGVPAPEVLQKTSTDEFLHLCHYLGLPSSCSKLLGSKTAVALALRWSQHEKVKQCFSSASSLTLVHYPLQVNQLVSLPADYSELFNSTSLFLCPNGYGSEFRKPAMCLICGTVLCSMSFCCRDIVDGDTSNVGACTYHAFYCGAGVGIFLQIRECRLFILTRKNKGCYISPPYLDEYGETDEGLSRGNPLYLQPEKYKDLHQLWLRHEIPEKISRVSDSDTNFIMTVWQNL